MGLGRTTPALRCPEAELSGEPAAQTKMSQGEGAGTQDSESGALFSEKNEVKRRSTVKSKK